MRRRSFTIMMSRVLLVLAAAALCGRAAQAGPPLVCWPVEIGDAKSLPWSETDRGVGGARCDYNAARLTEDTLAFLSPDVAVLVRMETLRRAALYAAKNRAAGDDLLARLVARATGSDSKAKPDALAWFDAGYFVEAYKQAVTGPAIPLSTRILQALGLSEAESKRRSLDGLNGYDWVLRALALGGPAPEMQYAAALITWYPRQARHEEHVAKAAAGAAEESLLAKNLLQHFADRGKTIGELMALGAGETVGKR